MGVEPTQAGQGRQFHRQFHLVVAHDVSVSVFNWRHSHARIGLPAQERLFPRLIQSVRHDDDFDALALAEIKRFPSPEANCGLLNEEAWR